MDVIAVGLRVLVSLAAVLAVIWYAHKRITKGRGAPAAKAISVVGRQGIGQKASVIIVEADGKRLLLGVTERSVTVLSDLTAEAAQPYRTPTSLHPRTVPVAVTFDDHMKTAAGESNLPEVPVAATAASIRPTFVAPTLSPASHGLLSGSILSAETWKRFLTVLRQERSK
ncbi:flagellar biosynthetic protein FliO [Glaciihabitans sp. dw_435]|uniref:FliO/MopB family protein n=1 Tax=Glaciihabitans sp. dw_435 TaxID=2720081 RepID=UPI001BD2FDCE|nr:flagellar biosynthetic protein FliO [Glaciihabitans sp. dw_435]